MGCRCLGQRTGTQEWASGRTGTQEHTALRPTWRRSQEVYFLALLAVVQLASNKNSLTWQYGSTAAQQHSSTGVGIEAMVGKLRALR